MYTPIGQVKVAKLVLQEAGVYNQQFLRPYQTHFNGQVIDSINSRLEQTVGKMTAADMSGLASQLLTPTAFHQGDIYINNGWNENRIRFLMEVHVDRNLGSTVIYFIQGYTDHVGVSTSGNIDPNMKFYINSFVQITRAFQNTPHGVVSQDVVTAAAQVIDGRLVAHPTMNYQEFYTSRPMDIYNGMQSQYQIAASEAYYPNSTVYNKTINHAGEVVKNSRKTNVPARYVADIVNSHMHGMSFMTFGQDASDRLSHARSEVYESPVLENYFIRAISSVQGVSTTSSFTYNDLLKVDPNAAANTNFLIVGTTERASLDYASSSEYWNGADRVTQVATILSNAVPALMMECMIGKISFNMSNHSSDGRANMIITSGHGLANVDMTMFYEGFKRRLELEVMNDITYGNQELYNLQMNVDLFGNTSIEIQLGSEPWVRFNTPSFCDGLISPIIMTNRDAFFTTCSDFELMMNNIETQSTGAYVDPRELSALF